MISSPSHSPSASHVNEHAKALDRRLLGLFETKAVEFTKYSDENPKTAPITMMIAGLYKDLADIVKH
jgi:hypothetical protein